MKNKFNAKSVIPLLLMIIAMAIILLNITTPIQPVIPEPEQPIITETVLSSWYGEAYQGKLTTSGEPFDRFAHTTAHPSLPFGTLVKLRNPKNGKEIVARVNDRGPYCEYPGSYYYSCGEKRGLDVSEHIAESLGFKHDGVALLEISVLREE